MGNNKLKEKIKSYIKLEKNISKLNVLDALNNIEDSSITYTRNKAKFVQVLRGLKTSPNVLYTTDILLHGDLDYYPMINLNSDFAMILLISDVIYMNKCAKKFEILIYEEDPRLFGKI